jgi:uncharacterized protein (TIGR00369 family)
MKRLPNSKSCFVCGDSNPAGLGIRFETDGERVWTRFCAGPAHCGYEGIVHGGVLAALLDETMGWAPCLQRRRFGVCVGLQIEYRKSVPAGQEVIVSGWTTNHARKVWEAAGEIRDADGVLYARATGRFHPVSEEAHQAVLGALQFDEGTVAAQELAPDAQTD